MTPILTNLSSVSLILKCSIKDGDEVTLSALSFTRSTASLFFVDFTSGCIHCICFYFLSQFEVYVSPLQTVEFDLCKPTEQTSISCKTPFSLTFTWLFYTVDLCIMWNGKMTVHASPIIIATLFPDHMRN